MSDTIEVPGDFYGAREIRAYAVGVAHAMSGGRYILSLSEKQHERVVADPDGMRLLSTLHLHGYVSISIRLGGGEGGAEP